MRLLTPAERRTRRDALADHALQLFAEVGYPNLTIEAVAHRAGVAKGTIFLAFSTKEDLFLHGAGRRFQSWMGRLANLDLGSASPKAQAAGILETLRVDPLLLPLISLVAPILEQRCTPEGVLAFKQTVALGFQGLVQAWAPRWPEVPAEAWQPLFMRFYASIVGAWSAGEPSENLRKALSNHPALGIFLTKFEELAQPMIEALLRQVQEPPRRVIDLTHPLHPGMPLFPGTPEPAFKPLGTLAKEGYAERWLAMASHTGTHIDAPAHLLPGGRGLDDFSVDHFIGPGVIIPVPATESIPLSVLLPHEEAIRTARFVLLHTGADARWGQPSYFQGFPVLDAEAANWLAAFELAGIGIDAPSLDPVESLELPNHRLFLSKDICLIENLRGLAAIGPEAFLFSALPLKLQDADGSPVRAVAMRPGP